MYYNRQKQKTFLCFLLCISLLLLPACLSTEADSSDRSSRQTEITETDTGEKTRDLSEAEERMEIWTGVSCGDLKQVDDAEDVPEYDGEIYAIINDDEPEFTEKELSVTESYEFYSELDDLGRCGVCIACIGTDIMPTEERGSIGEIKPTGWHTVKYDSVDGMYLYNRCHLIAYELAAENANEKNLITGTRYFNVEGMLPLENMVTDFIEETEYHVLYRVTPVFEGDNLLASGVQMEARSLEDNGEGICFNVYVYNIQPGIEIDYATGESRESEEEISTVDSSAAVTAVTYIVNTNTKKFHKPTCSSVEDIAEYNRKEYSGSREALIRQGFEPCKRCNP